MALDFGCAAEGAAAGLLSGGLAEVAAVASIDFSGFPLFLDSSRENNALYIADASCDGSTFVFFFFFFFGRSTGTTASVGGSGGAAANARRSGSAMRFFFFFFFFVSICSSLG